MTDDKIERKIAVIFATDVVGYSKHMERDEDETLKSFRACKKILEKLFEEHGGTIFNTAGDSVLAEFPSAVSAVVCASEFQELIKERNDNRQSPINLQFRIGINMGDVVKEDSNLYGDGVNIAARLEALAQPDGICLSKSVYDLVNKKTKFLFSDLGEQKVKENQFHAFDLLLDPSQKRRIRSNKHFSVLMFAAIATLLVITVGGLLYFLSSQTDPQKLAIQIDTPKENILGKTLLILPFDNVSDSSYTASMKKSIIDHLISSISSTVMLNIVPRQKSYVLKEKFQTVEDLYRETGASFILSGSALGSEENFRISLELLDVRKEKILWSANYEFSKSDLFSTLDEIEFSVRRMILSKLTMGEEATQYLEKHFINSKDFLEILRLRVALLKEGTSIERNHSEPFRKILEKNPDSSGANYLYARSLIRQLGAYRENSNVEIKDIFKANSRALELDPGNAPAYAFKATLKKRFQLKFDETLLRTALRYGEDNYLVLETVADVYRLQAKPEEAITYYKQALEVAPYGPSVLKLALFASYLEANRIKDARELAKEMISSDKFLEFWGQLCLIYIEAINGEKISSSQMYKEFLEKNKISLEDLLRKIETSPMARREYWVREELIKSLKGIDG